MTYHIITDSTNNRQLPSHERAAAERGLSLNIIDASTITFASLPVVDPGDIFLRIGVATRARTIEKFIFESAAGHIYADNVTGVFSRSDDSFFTNKHDGLPLIPTVPFLPLPEELDQVVELLGGFPIIAKITGGQNGVGLMKLDSISSLRSVRDYLQTTGKDVWLRQFFPHVYQARLVVVGDQVVGSHKNFLVAQDFRTNVTSYGDRKFEAAVFSEEMQAIAVASVHSLGYFYGGVDLLVNENGKYLIAEMNTPCALSLTERISNVDIAGPLADFLISRANCK